MIYKKIFELGKGLFLYFKYWDRLKAAYLFYSILITILPLDLPDARCVNASILLLKG